MAADGPMTITTRFDDITDLRVHVVRGELTHEELCETLEALYATREFQPQQSALWDLREADLTGSSAAEVRQIAELVQQHWGTTGVPRAALVVSRDVDFGIARMFELYVTTGAQREVRVFREFDEAVAWVTGVPSP